LPFLRSLSPSVVGIVGYGGQVGVVVVELWMESWFGAVLTPTFPSQREVQFTIAISRLNPLCTWQVNYEKIDKHRPDETTARNKRCLHSRIPNL
jgi:hypothetical protein